MNFYWSWQKPAVILLVWFWMLHTPLGVSAAALSPESAALATSGSSDQNQHAIAADSTLHSPSTETFSNFASIFEDFSGGGAGSPAGAPQDALQKLLHITVVLFVLLVFFFGVLRFLQVEIRERTLSLHREIDERNRLLNELRQRKNTILSILNSAHEGIFGVDRNGICTFFNASAQHLLGYSAEAIVGGNTHGLFAHSDTNGRSRDHVNCRVAEVLNSAEPRHIDDAVLWSRDGIPVAVSCTVQPILDAGEVAGAVVSFTDIREKKKLIEQRIRTSQLVSLGEMATGVGHEINNPINGVINYAQLLLNRYAQSEIEKKILKNIIKEGNRIAGIVANLLNFAHKDRSSMQSLAIPALLNTALDLIGKQLDKDGIHLVVEMGHGLPEIFGNEQKMEEVLINLISNARHALNEKYPGGGPDKRLWISAQQVPDINRPMIMLTVLDHGIGIKPEHLSRIYNPFFTTKPAGVGTGLGLSIVHESLHQMGAKISIESIPSHFTRVSMLFPGNETAKPCSSQATSRAIKMETQINHTAAGSESTHVKPSLNTSSLNALQQVEENTKNL